MDRKKNKTNIKGNALQPLRNSERDTCNQKTKNTPEMITRKHSFETHI